MMSCNSPVTYQIMGNRTNGARLLGVLVRDETYKREIGRAHF